MFVQSSSKLGWWHFFGTSTTTTLFDPPINVCACAIQLDSKRLLIFGGVNRRTRFNDLWVFDAASDGKGSWARVETEGLAPEPRAHFSAVRFGERIFMFGGYGGGGQVYGDMWVLHFGGSTFRWENVTDQLQGDGPSPRFDHSAFIFPVTPNSDTFDKMMVLGGRDVGQVLWDAHLLDLATMTWERGPDGAAWVTPSGEVCCAAAEDVESVPYHKVWPRCCGRLHGGWWLFGCSGVVDLCLCMSLHE